MSHRIAYTIGAVMVLAFCGRVSAEVQITTVTVGHPGNTGDPAGQSVPDGGGEDRICGTVDYFYDIGEYEVTAGQYTEFLNAVADPDTHGLYNGAMWSNAEGCQIQQTGTSGNYVYIVSSDWANRPVNLVSWFDTLRFANWMHNGQPNGAQDEYTTEDGAYDMSLGAGAVRKPGARFFLPTEDEWHKAAYHKNDDVTGNFYDYPTCSDLVPSNDLIDPDPGNNATYFIGPDDWTIGSPYYRTVRGEHENSASCYGTLDQCGNVAEWTETQMYAGRTHRGGQYYGNPNGQHAAFRGGSDEAQEGVGVGFRIATITDCNANGIDDNVEIAGQFDFALPADVYDTQTYPYWITSADLDGDGHIDLAVSNNSSNTVSMFWNDGNGQFPTRSDCPVESSPVGLDAGDVNGDGLADLAVVEAGVNSVSVLISDGVRGCPTPAPESVGSLPAGVTIADLNGDGWADLAVTNRNDDTVSILLNRGDGTFDPQVTWAVGDLPGSVKAADLNGDGDLDLVVANHAGDSVSVLININEEFGDGTDYDVADSPSDIVLVDLDGDSDIDIAASCQRSFVTVLRNLGDGTLGQRLDTAVGTMSTGMTGADFDGDGDIDLATANYDGRSISALLNHGDATFDPADILLGVRAYFATSADFDGDSDDDLVVTNVTANTISVLMNASIPPVADLNGNGVPDVCDFESPTLADPPHDIRKNRYISIDLLGVDVLSESRDFDIRVMLSSTLVNGIPEIGGSWWANAPDEECISIVGPTRPATPPNWGACPTLHLTGCPIIPTSTYDIVVVADTFVTDPPLSADTQALPTGSKWWGDVVGQFDPVGDAWGPPNGVVAIDDAVAAIKTYQNPSLVGPGCGTPPCNATHTSVTDVHPAGFPGHEYGTPNLQVDINDVFAIILGFQGIEYSGPEIVSCIDP